MDAGASVLLLALVIATESAFVISPRKIANIEKRAHFQQRAKDLTSLSNGESGGGSSANGNGQQPNVVRCYEMATDCILLNALPYTRVIGRSVFSCFQMCLSLAREATPPCRGFQYDRHKFTCHFFTYAGMRATRWAAYGYDYFELRPECYSPVVGTSTTTASSTSTSTTKVRSTSTTTPAPVGLPLAGVCVGDTQPLIQKAEGFKFQSDDVITIRGISQAECIQDCVGDQDGTGEQYFCFSGFYDRNSRTCSLSVTAPEPSATGGVLVTQAGSLFFQKMCISNNLARLCPSLMVERFSQMVLVGFQRMTITASDFEMCIELCLGSQQRLGFQCKSLMFYHSTPNQEDNCLLNYEDHKAEPQLFIPEPNQKVDYVAIGMCQRQRALIAKDEAEPPILIIREIKTIMSLQ